MKFDLIFLLIWLIWGGFGFILLIKLYKKGVSVTYIRDLLHLGSGSWVLGFPLWNSAIIPIILTVGALLGITLLPYTTFKKALSGVTNHQERFSGIWLYVLSFTLITTISFLLNDRYQGAIALGILAAGDGMGGLIGKKFGKKQFKLPWVKAKSYIGTATVMGMSLMVLLILTPIFNHSYTPSILVIIPIFSGIIEALSPRGTDNFFLPVMIFISMIFLGS